MHNRATVVSTIASAFLIFAARQTMAANGTWYSTNTVSGNAFWTNSWNWSARPYPAGNQTAFFTQSGNGRTTIDLTGLNFGVSNIVFDTTGSAAYTLGSNGVNQQTLMFTNNSNFRMSPTVLTSQRIDATSVLGHDRSTSAHTFRNESPFGMLTLAGDVRAPTSGGAPGGKTLTITGVGGVVVSGNILTNGFSSLTLTDSTSGTLLLSGSNRINTVNANAGTLALYGTNRFDTLNVNNNSILNVSGSNVVSTLNINGTGGTIINIVSGFLAFDNGGGQTIIANQNTVINGPGAVVLPIGPPTNLTGDNYSAAGKTLTINAPITGNNGMELWSGTGTYVLGGSNDFNGNITLGPAGTLSVSRMGKRGSYDSNLGRGTTISLNASGSKLLYTGAGETSDRTISILSNVTIDQSGTGHLNLSYPVTVSSGTKTLTLQGSTEGTAEFSGLLRNDSGVLILAKAGTGTWLLSTNDTYTGATTVSGGTLALTGPSGAIASSTAYAIEGNAILQLQNAPDANNTNRLRDASILTMSGGTLSFSHAGGAANYAENMGALSLSLNNNVITASRASVGYTSTLTFSSLARASGATVNFVGDGLGTDSRNKILIGGVSDGLIGSWATVNGTNLAAYSSALGVYASAEPAYSQEISALGPSTINDAPSDFVRISTQGTSGDIDLELATTRIAGLKQDTVYGAIVKTAGKTLQTAGIAIPSEKGAVTIGASAGDGTLSALTSGGDLTLANSSDAALTVNAAVANNGSASSLTKTGAGAATLSTANTFSGPTTVAGGTLVLADGNALQNSTVCTTGTVFNSSVSGHAFTFGGLSGNFGLALDDNAETPSPVELTIGGNHANTTVSGPIGGSGSLIKTGNGTLALTGYNSFAGSLTINSGLLIASNANALGTAGVVNNGTLNLMLSSSDFYYSALSNSLSGSGTINVWLATGGSTTRLNGDYSGFTGLWNIGTNALAGAAKVMMNGADNAAAVINVLSNGTVMCSGPNTHYASLILRGGNLGEVMGQLRLDNGSTWAGPVTLAGPITDTADGHIGNPSGQGVVSGVIGQIGAFTFTKTGAGTNYLSNANTFPGPVWIRNGGLRVDTVGSVGGGASGLGNPSSAAEATLIFGTGNTNATLIYTGQGETSDRPIQLAGTTATTYLWHSGSNTLALTGDITSLINGNKRLQLQGTSPGEAILAGVFSDFSTASSNTLYKAGTGTWTIAANNTFKGSVTNEDGILRITKSEAFGNWPKVVENFNSANNCNPHIFLNGAEGDLTIPAVITFRTSNARSGAICNEAGNNTILGALNLVSGDGDTILNSVSGKLTVAGNVWPPTDTGRQLRLRGDGDGEISGVIANGATASLPVIREPVGTGTWTLSGSNTYSGITYALGGTLAVSGPNGFIPGQIQVASNASLVVINSALTNSPNRLSDSSSVTLNGGTFDYSHDGGSASYSETAGALIVGTSSNTLAASQADESQSSVLTFASLTRTGNGTLDFVGSGLGVDSRNKVMFTSPPASGLIGLWATYNSTNFAAYDSVNGVVAADDSFFTDIPARGPFAISDDATLNARITSDGVSGPLALAGTTTSQIRTLQQQSGQASEVGMTNQTLLVSEILIAPGKSGLTLGTEPEEGLVMPLAANGTLTLFNSSDSTLTLNASVTNNSGNSSVAKFGAGAVVLNGRNSYTGSTLIDEGSLEFGGASAQKLSGVISGKGSLIKSGTNLLHLTAANTYSGPTYINSGTVRPNDNATFGTTASGVFIADGATLDVGCTPDVGGTRPKEGLYLQTEPITVEGSGANGAGVIVNVSTASQMNAIGKLSLSGDATFGGTQRWDIRNYPVSFNDHTFTKTGVNEIAIIAANVNPGAGHIAVNQGLLRFETTMSVNGSPANTITVQANATLDLWNHALASATPWSLVLNDRSIFRDGSGNGTNYNVWTGPVTLNGTAFLYGSGTTSKSVLGDISGTGTLVKNGNSASTLYLSGNNSYGGGTIISNGTLFAKYAQALSGSTTPGAVTVVGGATLAVASGNGTDGWNADQLRSMHDSASFLSNTSVLSVDTTLTNLFYPHNLNKPLALTKQGNNTLALGGTNTFTGAVVVNKGALVFDAGTTNVTGSVTVNSNSTLMFGNGSTNTFGSTTLNSGSLSYGAGSTNIGSGSITVKGGTSGAFLNIDGPVTVGKTSLTLAVGTSANDRSVVRSTSDITCYGIRMSEGTAPMSSAYFNDGGTLNSTRLLLACTTGNTYSYCRFNGGVANISEYFYVGFRGVGVMDMLDGIINPVGASVVAASISPYAGSMGALNVMGGTVNAPSNGEPLAFSRVDGNLPNGQLNVIGSGLVNAAAGSGTTKILNMNIGTLDGGKSVVNLVSGGTLIANKIGYTKRGDQRMNFNGGVLKAAPSTTVGSTFLQGLTAATIYPGGVTVDTTNANVTIAQPLEGCEGYGVASVSLSYGGLGYIGAPYVEISGGSGTGATAIAAVDSDPLSTTYGKVTGITVTCPGTGYQAGDLLLVTLFGGGFTNNMSAVACATLGPNAMTGGLTKQGSGSLTLGGTNTYGGATTIAEGTVKLGNALALPTGTDVVLAGGTLDLNGFTVTNAISGAGTVTNGAIETVISPAGEGALGVEDLAFRSVSVQGLYLADVTAHASDRVDVHGSLDLSGIDLQIVDPALLNRQVQYEILTCDGTLSGTFKSNNLPDSRWHVIYQESGTVKLVFVDGTVLLLR